MQHHKCDVLVIGSGAAGLRAAIEAHDAGAEVIVLGKCRRGEAHTAAATSGINAAMGAGDSWQIHAADTLKEGQFLADWHAVETLCKNAPAAVAELQSWGIEFAKGEGGKLLQRRFGGHTHGRTCFVGDHTGRAVMDALVRETKRRKILFFEEVYVTSLTKHNGAVNGAVGFDMFGNDIMLFSSRAVVLAAGGYSNIYSRSGSKAGENTGDAASLAFQAGAELQDMEMVQFHPTGLVWPAKVAGAIVAEAVRAEGGVLYNDKGERFMGRYDRRMELGPRDVVARAVHSEILGGRGSRRKAVWLDFRHREKENIEQQLPSTYRQMLSLGVDISEDLIEVAPTAHYSMGGIRTGVNGETNVPGLYAVGEAVAGLHGANRLGGNLLTEAIVFGRIVGAAAAAAAKQTELNQIDYNEVMEKTGTAKGAKQGKPRPKSVRRLRLSLQNAMSRHAGVVRDQKGLQTALREVEAVKKKIHRARPAAGLNRNFADFWDLCHMTVAAEAVVRSALLRKESRGAHFRADYPVQDDRMMFNIICSNEGGAMKLRTSRVPHPSSELNLLAKVLHEPQRADAE